MATTPEGKVKKEVDKLLKELKVFYWPPPANGYGASGVADRICIINGRVLAIECKDIGKKPTNLQQMFLTNVTLAGGWTFVAYIDNLYTLVTMIHMMKRMKP